MRKNTFRRYLNMEQTNTKKIIMAVGAAIGTCAVALVAGVLGKKIVSKRKAKEIEVLDDPSDIQ